MKEGRKQKGSKDWGLGLKGAQLVSQILTAKGHVLSFLESQLGKMAILKLLSLKRLREETSGCPKGILQQTRCFCSSYDSTALTQSHILGPPRSHRRELVSLETGLKSKHNPLSIQRRKILPQIHLVHWGLEFSHGVVFPLVGSTQYNLCKPPILIPHGIQTRP